MVPLYLYILLTALLVVHPILATRTYLTVFELHKKMPTFDLLISLLNGSLWTVDSYIAWRNYVQKESYSCDAKGATTKGPARTDHASLFDSSGTSRRLTIDSDILDFDSPWIIVPLVIALSWTLGAAMKQIFRRLSSGSQESPPTTTAEMENSNTET